MAHLCNIQTVYTGGFMQDKQYAERLRAARKHRGFSQVRLAAALELPQARISEWERGVYFPSKRSWLAMGHALNIPWFWLAYGVFEEPAQTSGVRHIYEVSADAVSALEGKEAELASAKRGSGR